MTGRSERSGFDESDALDRLARAAAGGLSRRQLAKLGGGLALSALVPRLAGPARAARTGFAHAAAKLTGTCPPQNAGTCGGAREQWTPGCKDPVANGSASEFNGCGPQAGLDLPILGHGDWVPDRPLDLANFFDACKGHDCCYGSCGSDKSACDTEFLKSMVKACVERPGRGQLVLGGPLLGIGLSNCLAVAAAYQAAVHDTQTGQDAYNSAQQEVCDCCDCPEGQTNCPDGCSDLFQDVNNCGACGHRCQFENVGQMPACCDGTCVDLSINPFNCGRCGHDCGPDCQCQHGDCTPGRPGVVCP